MNEYVLNDTEREHVADIAKTITDLQTELTRYLNRVCHVRQLPGTWGLDEKAEKLLRREDR